MKRAAPLHLAECCHTLQKTMCRQSLATGGSRERKFALSCHPQQISFNGADDRQEIAPMKKMMRQLPRTRNRKTCRQPASDLHSERCSRSSRLHRVCMWRDRLRRMFDHSLGTSGFVRPFSHRRIAVVILQFHCKNDVVEMTCGAPPWSRTRRSIRVRKYG